MASFINLLGNDVWSDADITNRTESILRAEFSATDEAVLNRKVSGHALGAYVLTAEDQAELVRFSEASIAARDLGAAARADMVLLQAALDYEAGITEGATAEVLALVAQRNPQSTEGI